jgi:hypothetical protein
MDNQQRGDGAQYLETVVLPEVMSLLFMEIFCFRLSG